MDLYRQSTKAKRHPRPSTSKDHQNTRRLVLRWLAGFFYRLPVGFELLAPLCRFVRLAPVLVELHQSLQGFAQADLAVRRDLGLPLYHPLVALHQERLGIGVILQEFRTQYEARYISFCRSPKTMVERMNPWKFSKAYYCKKCSASLFATDNRRRQNRLSCREIVSGFVAFRILAFAQICCVSHGLVVKVLKTLGNGKYTSSLRTSCSSTEALNLSFSHWIVF